MHTIIMFFYRFEKVPLVTPNGDVLIEELNFEVSTLYHNNSSLIVNFDKLLHI